MATQRTQSRDTPFKPKWYDAVGKSIEKKIRSKKQQQQQGSASATKTTLQDVKEYCGKHVSSTPPTKRSGLQDGSIWFKGLYRDFQDLFVRVPEKLWCGHRGFPTADNTPSAETCSVHDVCMSFMETERASILELYKYVAEKITKKDHDLTPHDISKRNQTLLFFTFFTGFPYLLQFLRDYPHSSTAADLSRVITNYVLEEMKHRSGGIIHTHHAKKIMTRTQHQQKIT